MAALGLALAFAAPAAAARASAPTHATDEPAQYDGFCNAIIGTHRAALMSLLASDFTLTDASGKVETRAAFVPELVNPYPVTFTRCSFRVQWRRIAHNVERDRVFWTLKGTVASGGSRQPFTDIADVEVEWVGRDGRWQQRSQTMLQLKEWRSRVLERTLVAPLTAKERAAIVADLRKYARPLGSAYPGGADGDLEPILLAAGSARVVAMGEATHGTSEFFALEDRVFRYLVEHGGVTVFAQETNWSDGENIDRYLQTGQGNLRDLLAATFPVWDNEETLELLQWMRAYNSAHPSALHFFGIDAQAPEDAAGAVVAFYKRYEPASAPAVARAEACVALPGVKMVATLESKDDGPKCAASTRAAFGTIASDAHLEAAAGRDAYLSAYHAADVAREAAAMWSQRGPLQRAAERDRAMAHNVEWMLATLYPRARAFVWAHNGHVGVGLEPWTSMGTYLTDTLKANYFTIGQTFDHGGISVLQPDPARVAPAEGNASEVIFRQAGMSPFFLDFAAVPKSTPLGRWLARPHGVRSIGALWKAITLPNYETLVRLPSAFDAIAFVDTAHAAHSFATPVSRSITFPPGTSGGLASLPWTLRSVVGEESNGGASALGGGKSGLFVEARSPESKLDTRLEARIDAAAYRGKTMRVRALLATSGVSAGSSMAVRVYGDEALRPLASADGPAEGLAGTNGWTPIEINVAVPQNAQRIAIDFTLVGSGTAWLSDLSLGNEVSAK